MGCLTVQTVKLNRLAMNFSKNPCSYTEQQLIEKLDNFIKINENDIQASFYNKTTDDKIFELLKKDEKKLILDYFNSQKNMYINDVHNQLNIAQGMIRDNFEEIAQNIITVEKGEQIYKMKINREIEKINRDINSFRIDFLTVMLVGQSGVGKSTLINKFLKLKKKAPTGTGKFVTTEIKDYRSEEIPYLRLIDTRGIELNVNYGAEAVKNDTTSFIMQQLNTGNINNFVSCIWYCITGNRFQQVEIDLLNALRSSYGDNTIPIIIVYTQATDRNTIAEMSKFIKDNAINATFIKVLADRKELENNTFLESFGLDILLKETLEKCRKAIQGDMRSVLANNISNYIKDRLINQNSYIRKFVNEITILNFTKNKYAILNDKDFEKYIIDIYGNNVRQFLEKDDITDKSVSSFHNFIINNNSIKSYYIQRTNELIQNNLDNLSIQLLDLQAKIELNNNSHIKIENKRALEGFRKTTLKFLQDNFYCLAQKLYISFIIRNINNRISLSFENYLNNLITNIIKHEDIIENINKCFIKKFDDFELRIKNPLNNNFYRPINNNYKNFDLEKKKQEIPPELPSENSYNDEIETKNININNANIYFNNKRINKIKEELNETGTIRNNDEINGLAPPSIYPVIEKYSIDNYNIK